MCGDLSQCFTGLCEQLLLQKGLEEKVNEGGHLREWETKLYPTAATLHRLQERREEKSEERREDRSEERREERREERSKERSEERRGGNKSLTVCDSIRNYRVWRVEL